MRNHIRKRTLSKAMLLSSAPSSRMVNDMSRPTTDTVTASRFSSPSDTDACDAVGAR